MENREGTSLMRHLVEDEGEDLLKFIELPKLVVLSGNSDGFEVALIFKTSTPKVIFAGLSDRYAKGETIVGKGKGLRSVRLSFFKETPLQQPLALSACFLDPARRARQDFSTGMTHKIVKSVILIACERVLPVSKDSRQQRKEQQGCAAPSQHQERMADDIKNTGNSPLKDIT
eukprot:jgi/Bigna1/127819/aug1.5_g2527